MQSPSFVIGALDGNHLNFKVFGYESPLENKGHDANWLSVELSVAAGCWTGRVRNAFLTTQEVHILRERLDDLLKDKVTELSFEPMEPHVVLKLVKDGNHIEASGVAFDNPEGVNAIAFNWMVDNKQLKSLQGQLREVESAFPVR
jgi:hypothetical protein